MAALPEKKLAWGCIGGGGTSGFEAASFIDFSLLGSDLHSLPLDSLPLVQNAKPSPRGTFRALGWVSLWENRPLVL